LDAKEARKFEEDARRREQRKLAAQAMAERNRRLASEGFGEAVSCDVMLEAMDVLDRRGTFYDEVEAEVQQEFLPWLSEEVVAALEIRELLQALKHAAAKRAIMIRDEKIREFDAEVAQPRRVSEERHARAMRKVLIEDRGAAAMRRRIREAKEKKEREAAEAAERAAKAEADAEAAAAAAAEAEASKGENEKEAEGDESGSVSDSN
jgi:hypothetical protein